MSKILQKSADPGEIDKLTYFLQSGSDRIGALDFQESPDIFIPRECEPCSLHATELLEEGKILSLSLEKALFHGSSIGGARPKALIEQGAKKYIAKFSSSSNRFSLIKGEFIAMRLAKTVGIHVANVELTQAEGKDILLFQRFDRALTDKGWARKGIVSALTLLGLDEMLARYVSYEDFAKIIRLHFVTPADALKELCSRLIFNILCGNTDDHTRNHAAFCGYQGLSLTPAYDLCPQRRSGQEATQAMRIIGKLSLNQKSSYIKAAEHFLLSPREIAQIFEKQHTLIRENWESLADLAELSERDLCTKPSIENNGWCLFESNSRKRLEHYSPSRSFV